MKRQKANPRGGVISLRLLSALAAIGLLLPLALKAAAPQWWSAQGVLKLDPATHQPVEANDYAAVNQGQVKNLAVKAIAELNAHLPGGSGDTLNALAVTLSGTTANTNDYAAVNLGQLKNLAKPFYDRLLAVGYTAHPLESGTYPWIGSSAPANDFAMANIGQVKNLFSFDLSVDQNGNGIPDWTEGNTVLDSDGDGIPDAQEIINGTNPAVKDNPTVKLQVNVMVR